MKQDLSALYQLTVNKKQNPFKYHNQLIHRRTFKTFRAFEQYEAHNCKVICTENVK